MRQLFAQSRYSSTPEELVIALSEEGYESRGDTLTAKGDAERKQVLEAIETLGTPTRAQLGDKTGLAATTLRRHLDQLCADGLVDPRGNGTRTDPYTYSPRMCQGAAPLLVGTDEEELERLREKHRDIAEGRA